MLTKNKIVKRLPHYADFNMVDMFGDEIYTTKNRYYKVVSGVVYSIPKKYSSFDTRLNLKNFINMDVYENK